MAAELPGRVVDPSMHLLNSKKAHQPPPTPFHPPHPHPSHAPRTFLFVAQHKSSGAGPVHLRNVDGSWRQVGGQDLQRKSKLPQVQLALNLILMLHPSVLPFLTLCCRRWLGGLARGWHAMQSGSRMPTRAHCGWLAGWLADPGGNHGSCRTTVSHLPTKYCEGSISGYCEQHGD